MVSCPITHSHEFRKKILNAWAWKNWNYSHCSGMYEVEWSFIPCNWANPTIWIVGKLELVREHRIETTCGDFELAWLIENIKKHHPYETPHIEVSDIELF